MGRFIWDQEERIIYKGKLIVLGHVIWILQHHVNHVSANAVFSFIPFS